MASFKANRRQDNKLTANDLHMNSFIPGSNVVIIESTEFLVFSAIFVMNSLLAIQSKNALPIESDRDLGEGLEVSFRLTLIVASIGTSIGADGKVCGTRNGTTASTGWGFSSVLFKSIEDNCLSTLCGGVDGIA